MVARLHPEVEVLCEMIAQHKKSFEDVASATGIKPERFRRIMTGEADMLLKEEDLICVYLGVSVREVILKGIELRESRRPPTWH